jgi:flagellar basal-body rod protein FlgB
MFDDLLLFKLTALKSRHAAERLATIAENVANADTPGYRARDIEDFSEVILRLGRDAPAIEFRKSEMTVRGAESPSGNNVLLEDQISRAARAARDHETASLIYSKALGFLRTALGKKG